MKPDLANEHGPFEAHDCAESRHYKNECDRLRLLVNKLETSLDAAEECRAESRMVVTNLRSQLASARSQLDAFYAATKGYTEGTPAETFERMRAENERLQAQLHGAEAANAADSKRLTEHCELSGHIEIVQQCCDWLNALANEEGDLSGRLRDFVTSTSIVIDQLDKQRRSRNWYECAYTAGKSKLIEHALSKQADQLEAERNRADEHLKHRDTLEHRLLAMTAARDEACAIARSWIECGAAWKPTNAHVNTTSSNAMVRIQELRAIGSAKEGGDG